MSEAAKSSGDYGDYKRLQLLGGGGQGRVFKAVCVSERNCHVQLNEIVALKILQRQGSDDKALQRFHRQTAILTALTHRNIVRYIESFIHPVNEWDEDMCLVMEFLEGDDLKTFIERNPKGLPWEQCFTMFEQCLEGLVHAVKHGVFHRDLKPSNVIVLPDGTVKLIDFGIAHFDDGGTATTGGFKGSFDYMAPDIVLESSQTNYQACDTFSLGVCLYQSLTGSLPFPPLGENAQSGYIQRWKNATPPDLSFSHKVFRVYPGARTVLRTCLTIRSEERYKSFEQVLEALRGVKPRRVRHADGDTYECVEWIGRGGFGEVYRAKRLSDGFPVAVKRLLSDDHSPDRFIREARLLSEFRHPHIVAYVDFIESKRTDDRRDYYLVLEYLEGMPEWSLRGRVKKAPQGLPLEEVLALFDGYLKALDYLHVGNGQGQIIHRDIKPANLYAPEGDPSKAKVFDLGVVRDVSASKSVGDIPGTPDYMPPEFGTKENRGTPGSDIYSLGLCLYEALTGTPALPPLPRDEKLAWIVFLERNKTLPIIRFNHPVFVTCPALRPIIVKALAQKTKNRYSSAALMLTELQRVAHLLHPVAEEVEPETRTRDHSGEVQAARSPLAPPPTVGVVDGETRGGGTVGLTRGGTVGLTRGGTVGLTRGETRGLTVGETVGELSKRRLRILLTARQRRRIALTAGIAAAAVLVVGGVVGGFTFLIRSRTDSFLRHVDALMQQDPQAQEAFVRDVCASYPRLVKLTADHPANRSYLERQNRLLSFIDRIPGAFSNNFRVALSRQDTNTAADVVSQWNAVTSCLEEVGPSSANIRATTTWMTQETSRMVRGARLGELNAVATSLSNRIPDVVTYSALDGLESLFVDIGKAKDRTWAPLTVADRDDRLDSLLDQLSDRVAAFMEPTWQAGAISDPSRRTELDQAPAKWPAMVKATRSTYDRVCRKVAQEVVSTSLHDNVVAAAKAIRAVQTEKDLADAFEKEFSPLTEKIGLTPKDRESLDGAIGYAWGAVSVGIAASVSNAYVHLDFAKGDKMLAGLGDLARSISAKVPVAPPDLGVVRAGAEQEQDRIVVGYRSVQQQLTQANGALKAVTTAVGSLAQHSKTVSPEVADVAVVKQAQADATTACRQALLAIVKQREPLAQRQIRIQTVTDLLKESTAGALQDADGIVQAALEREERLFVLRIQNGSPSVAMTTLGVNEGAIRVPAGTTQDTELSATGKSVAVRIDSLETGYLSQETNIMLSAGGSVQLTVRPFDPSPVAITVVLPAIPSGEPPVTASYRVAGETQFNASPTGSVNLLPGDHEFAFKREDYADMGRKVSVKVGAGSVSVEGPALSEWIPSTGLKTLRELEALGARGEWAALAGKVAGLELELKWPAHAEAFRKLRDECYRQVTKDVGEKIGQADAEVRAYCAWLYQVAEPDTYKLRRLKESMPLPALSSFAVNYPLEAVTNSVFRAQYRRLKAWQAGAHSAKDDAGRQQLGAVLKPLGLELGSSASGVADRCGFESELLVWNYQVGVPPGLKTEQIEYVRWQAHSSFRPNEPSPEVLKSLAGYVTRGGAPDHYDTVLAIYEAFYCWDNYIRSVKLKKEEGVVPNSDKTYTRDPEAAYRNAVAFHRPAALQAHRDLLTVLKAANPDTTTDTMAYLATHGNDSAVPLLARYLGDSTLPPKEWRDAAGKIRGIGDKSSPDDFKVLKDLLH